MIAGSCHVTTNSLPWLTHVWGIDMEISRNNKMWNDLTPNNSTMVWGLLVYCTQHQTTKANTNTIRLRQNGCHFADNIFKCIFLNEIIWISIKLSLKFVPEGPMNYIPALVQIMAWCWLDDKPSSESMLVNLLMHICATWPQWVNNCSVRINQLILRSLLQQMLLLSHNFLTIQCLDCTGLFMAR